MKNTVLEKYKACEPCVGIFSHLLSSIALSALGQTGLDYVVIDLEHSPVSEQQAAELIAVSKGVSICPLVRVNAIARGQMLKMLDSGAMGLIVPQIHTADEVHELVKLCKFPPLGERGYCPTIDGGWGVSEDYKDGLTGYMRNANEKTLLLPQCETVGCLEHIEEIVAIDGVAGIFIGPYDLSIAMEIPGQFKHPNFLAAIESVQNACSSAGKLCIIFCGNKEEAAFYLRQGFLNIAVGIDILTLISITSEMVNFVKQSPVLQDK